MYNQRIESIPSVQEVYNETYVKAYKTRHLTYQRAQAIVQILLTVVVLLSVTASSGIATYVASERSRGMSIISTDKTREDISVQPNQLTTTSVRESYSLQDTRHLPSEYSLTQSASRGKVLETTTYVEMKMKTIIEEADPLAEKDTDEDVELLEAEPIQDVEPEVTAEPLPAPTQGAGPTEMNAAQLAFVEKVVEAEVTGTSYTYAGNPVGEDEMLLSKIRVAQVFLNRARDNARFSHVDTLYEACADPGASSTVFSGRYNRVYVTDLTKQAVQMAIDPNQPDLTDGALFFLANGAKTNPYGSYLFTDSVGHSFFK